LLWVAYETTALSVEYVEVPIRNLPSAFSGFRIAHISDLHGRAFAPGGPEAKAINAANVDLIVATGDFVHRSAGEAVNLLPFMRALVEMAPVYAVSGNHDHRADWPSVAAHLRAAGVTVLENSHIRLQRGDQTIYLAGVGDISTGHANLRQALPGEDDAVVILLVHAPTWFEPWNAKHAPDLPLFDRLALTLAGHTHGGQVKLPGLGAVTTVSGRLFPPSHVQGLSREGDGYLYINRGLAHGAPGFRFLSRREITIVTLLADLHPAQSETG
jgi:predicted MPP superfamily phosphohydrolase